MEKDYLKLLATVEELTSRNFEYREEIKRLRKENEQLKSQSQAFRYDDGILNNQRIQHV